MSRSTISTFQLFAMFPDQETARVYLEGRLWPNGVRCPVCGLGERITTRKDGFYRCNQCKEDFTVRTGSDQIAAFHSMTSSARARSACGTVRPSALAVFTLTIISTLTDCCTGIPAGFSPFRTRAT